LHGFASIVTISTEVFRKKSKLHLHSVLPELLLCQKVPPPILLELYPAEEVTINTSADKAHFRKMYRPKNNFSLCIPTGNCDHDGLDVMNSLMSFGL
jgi:hypothetical protein